VDLKTASDRIVSQENPLALAERDSDRTVVWLRGEHDASTVPALWETIDGAIARDDADLVVDLSGVEFMGSATVGVIIRARELLRPRSRSLTVRCPSRCAQRVLDLYGLSDLLDPRTANLAPGVFADLRAGSMAGRDGS
jgi:anti-sigma B factor antagonist